MNLSKLTLEDLARSLSAGSVRLEEVQLQLHPSDAVPQDESYHRYKIEQAKGIIDIHTELVARVRLAWVPKVVQWS